MRNRNLDNFLKINRLFAIYGNLLTEKQQNIVSLYYQEDFSLSEISENLNISRQAVHDTLKKSEELLLNFENQLHLISRFEKNASYFTFIYQETKGIYNNEISRFSSNEKESLKKIMEICEEGLNDI